MKTLLISLVLGLSTCLHAARFIVESGYQLSKSELKASPFKIEPFFSNYYVMTAPNEHSLKDINWIKRVELTFELQSYSLLPANNPVMLVEDELFAYQWGLFNQGQTFFREKDDIHNLPMVGLPDKDIGWKNLLPSLSQNRVIVAVLDSGVDLKHPDLIPNLWKNEKECGKDPKIDNDGNKLPGDCDGWNFTESIDSDSAKDPSDIDGHGTHVAGIIAAANNGYGIIGVTPNALIMPVKVMKDSNSKSEVASSESFARGIVYAVENGAKIINMSLGWPRALETQYLRDAVSFALSKGVIIVAAAGNNNNSEPLFPCAYDGVVCVGSTNLLGSFAGFSNFGGHVDTMTPGEGVLSTIPTLYEPDFFAIPGFDIKSGTSQSAPLVAGLLASLKALRPELKIDDVFARLYQSPQNEDKNKYVLGGSVTWESLSQDVTSPVIRPVLKRVRQIVVRSDLSDSRLVIPIRNYGLSSGEFQVKVESLSKGIEIQSEALTVPALASSQVKELSFAVRVLDLFSESNIKIKVTVIEGEKSLSFLNEIPVVRDIKADANLTKYQFTFTDKPIPLGGIKNREIAPFIFTVDSVTRSEKHDFFMKRIIKNEKESPKLEVTIFNRKGLSYVQAPKLILIDNALNMINLIRVDVNFDGNEDYVVQTLAVKDSKKYFVFSFYDKDMNPVWSSFQHVPLELDLFLDSMNEISFVKFQHPKLGAMKVPTFFTSGQLPKVDQVLSAFDRLDVTNKTRLYYLEPMEEKFRVRALTTNVWVDALKKELKSKWYETVVVEQVLPVTDLDAKNSQVRILVSVGHLTKRQLFIYTFDIAKDTRGQALPQLVLQTEEIDPIYSLTSKGLQVVGDLYFNVYDRTRSKVVMTKDQFQEGEYVYKHVAQTDVIAGHLITFDKGSEKFSVLQSREELIGLTISKKGILKTTKRPKLRYSFLSQKLLSEMYYPVTFKRDGVHAPALYVDATAVTGNRIYLYEERAGELVSSIKNSVVVPAGCKAMNPTFSEQSGTYEYVFLCLEENSWIIKTFMMN